VVFFGWRGWFGFGGVQFGGVGVGPEKLLAFGYDSSLVTSSFRLISNFLSLVTIVNKNLLMLFEYSADDWPANLDGKSV
jgi:hypothetical protein